MSGKRSLSRNPLTQWRRLVEDNLTSLGGTPQRKDVSQGVFLRNTIAEDKSGRFREMEDSLGNDIESTKALYQGQSTLIDNEDKLPNADIDNPEIVADSDTDASLVPFPYDDLKYPPAFQKESQYGEVETKSISRSNCDKIYEQPTDETTEVNKTHKLCPANGKRGKEENKILPGKHEQLSHDQNCLRVEHSWRRSRTRSMPKRQAKRESPAARKSQSTLAMVQTSRSLTVIESLTKKNISIATESRSHKSVHVRRRDENRTSSTLMNCLSQNVNEGTRDANEGIKQFKHEPKPVESSKMKDNPQCMTKRGEMKICDNKHVLEHSSTAHRFQFRDTAKKEAWLLNAEMTNIEDCAHHDFGGGGDLTFQAQIFTKTCEMDGSLGWVEKGSLNTSESTIGDMDMSCLHQPRDDSSDVNEWMKVNGSVVKCIKENQRYKKNFKRKIWTSTINTKGTDKEMIMWEPTGNQFKASESLPVFQSESLQKSVPRWKAKDGGIVNLLIGGRAPFEINKAFRFSIRGCTTKTSHIRQNKISIRNIGMSCQNSAHSMKRRCQSKPAILILNEAIFLKPEVKNIPELEDIRSFYLRKYNQTFMNRDFEYNTPLEPLHMSMDTLSDNISKYVETITKKEIGDAKLIIYRISQTKREGNTFPNSKETIIMNGEPFSRDNNRVLIDHCEMIEARGNGDGIADSSEVVNSEKISNRIFPIVKELSSNTKMIKVCKQLPLLEKCIEKDHKTQQNKHSTAACVGETLEEVREDPNKTMGHIEANSQKNDFIHLVENSLFSSENIDTDSQIINRHEEVGHSLNKIHLSTSFGMDVIKVTNARNVTGSGNDRITAFNEMGRCSHTLSPFPNKPTLPHDTQQSEADDYDWALQSLPVREYSKCDFAVSQNDDRMIEISHLDSEDNVKSTDMLDESSASFYPHTGSLSNSGGLSNKAFDMVGDTEILYPSGNAKAEGISLHTDIVLSDDTDLKSREGSNRIYDTIEHDNVRENSNDEIEHEPTSITIISETNDKDNTPVALHRDIERKNNASRRKSYTSDDNNYFSWNTPPENDVFLPKRSEYFKISVQNVQPQQDFHYIDDIFSDGKSSHQKDCVDSDVASGNELKKDERCATMDMDSEAFDNKYDLGQSSLECLLEQLIQRGKITLACILSLDRKILARSKNASLSQHDVSALCDGAMGHYDGLMKITLFDEVVYMCFQCDNHTVFMGRAPDSVLVCKLGLNSLVAGFAPPHSSGSCLKEIKEFADVLTGRGL